MIAKLLKTEQDSKISLQNIEATQQKVLSSLKSQYSVSIYFSNTTSVFAIIILTLVIIIFPILDLINCLKIRKKNNTVKLEVHDNNHSLSILKINETSFINQIEKIENVQKRKIKKPVSRKWRY